MRAEAPPVALLPCGGASILACQSEARWPLLEHFALTHTKLSACHLTALANWTLPSLKQLELTSTRLDIVGVQYLAEGHWPLLDTLILTLNPLEEGHFALLANGDWPLLHILHVSYDYVEVSAFAILSICQFDVMTAWAQVLRSRSTKCNLSNWQLRILVRQGNFNFWPRLKDVQVVYL